MPGLTRAALFAAGAIVACAAGAALAQAPAPGEGGGGAPIVAKVPLVLHEPKPVSAQMLVKPADGDWLMFRRTLNGWGYSPLAQITPANVKGLRLAWSRALPTGSYEGTPIVHEGVMYIIAPNDQIQAVDAATGDLIWNYKRRYAEGFRGGGSKRNAAIFENLIIDTSADGFVYAVDIKTGKQVWETKVTDWKTQSASTSGGPRRPCRRR